MNPIYSQFKKMKDQDREANVKARSMLTLEWYERIGRLLDDESYSYAYDFLKSVADFIEKKEYLTDGQIEGVKNIIANHQSFGYGKWDGEPF